ncbi:MAG: class II fumarate hydratase [Planctomycetes bacterium]|nr:class II fumarate hydratase [Planctomycetota bacterium]
MATTRTETDSMGPVEVPATALYGAQTARAVENFPVSGRRVPRAFLGALGALKAAAARTNEALGRLEPRLAGAIARAADEVAVGGLDEHFPIDVFQTGSGTSTNMNANEVIANRAIQLLGGKVGTKAPVHPNDHVNLGQSSNDVIPSVAHVAALATVRGETLPALVRLAVSLARRARALDEVVTVGRTHLMDATPVRLSQVFGGYAAQVQRAHRRVASASRGLEELALGGTAVGTGLNAHPEFAPRTIARLAEATGLSLREASDHFEAQGARDALVHASAALRSAALSLYKVANDLRWRSSGPSCGLGEIHLPDLQPGSSIMPGKVNPVIPEVVRQVVAQVVGHDAAIAFAGASGELELHVQVPVMAVNFLDSASLLARAATLLAQRCVDGIQADREQCERHAGRSPSLVTALNPVIGYDRAAQVAKEAVETGRLVKDLVVEQGLVPRAKADELLDPRRMTGR